MTVSAAAKITAAAATRDRGFIMLRSLVLLPRVEIRPRVAFQCRGVSARHPAPVPCYTLTPPFGPNRQREGPMAGFLFRLELEDGTPAEPPTFATAVPNWRSGG